MCGNKIDCQGQSQISWSQFSKNDHFGSNSVLQFVCFVVINALNIFFFSKTKFFLNFALLLASNVTQGSPQCSDKKSDCSAYGPNACTGQFKPWARDNCAKTCNLCCRFFRCIG